MNEINPDKPKEIIKKAELIKILSKRINIKASTTKFILETFIDTLLEIIQEGNDIHIRGYGTLTTKKKKGVVYKDMFTGEVKMGANKYRPFFVPAMKTIVKRPCPFPEGFDKDEYLKMIEERSRFRAEERARLAALQSEEGVTEESESESESK
jgi:nucleoid DNA-binding protein